jgi:hypothetical protein
VATVTERVVTIQKGEVWIDLTFDDVTDVISQVTSHNPFPDPVGRLLLTRVNGTVVFDGPIPVGDVVRNIPGNTRRSQFNYMLSG